MFAHKHALVWSSRPTRKAPDLLEGSPISTVKNSAVKFKYSCLSTDTKNVHAQTTCGCPFQYWSFSFTWTQTIWPQHFVHFLRNFTLRLDSSGKSREHDPRCKNEQLFHTTTFGRLELSSSIFWACTVHVEYSEAQEAYHNGLQTHYSCTGFFVWGYCWWSGIQIQKNCWLHLRRSRWQNRRSGSGLRLSSLKESELNVVSEQEPFHFKPIIPKLGCNISSWNCQCQNFFEAIPVGKEWQYHLTRWTVKCPTSSFWCWVIEELSPRLRRRETLLLTAQKQSQVASIALIDWINVFDTLTSTHPTLISQWGRSLLCKKSRWFFCARRICNVSNSDLKQHTGSNAIATQPVKQGVLAVAYLSCFFF